MSETPPKDIDAELEAAHAITHAIRVVTEIARAAGLDKVPLAIETVAKIPEIMDLATEMQSRLRRAVVQMEEAAVLIDSLRVENEALRAELESVKAGA